LLPLSPLLFIVGTLPDSAWCLDPAPETARGLSLPGVQSLGQVAGPPQRPPF
jgi:hypothetical protein